MWSPWTGQRLRYVCRVLAHCAARQCTAYQVPPSIPVLRFESTTDIKTRQK